jgi:hypothetical protein
MSLEQLSFLSQIISAVAVVGSLLFVGVQLRQATRAVRASSSQAHSTTYHAVISSLINDGEFARIWRVSLGNPEATNPDERVRFVAYASALFRYYESSRVQWLRGQLDEEHWQNVEQQVITLKSQPGIKWWWTIRGNWHSASFRTWFEALPTVDRVALYGPEEIARKEPGQQPASRKSATTDG